MLENLIFKCSVSLSSIFVSLCYFPSLILNGKVASYLCVEEKIQDFLRDTLVSPATLLVKVQFILIESPVLMTPCGQAAQAVSLVAGMGLMHDFDRCELSD